MKTTLLLSFFIFTAVADEFTECTAGFAGVYPCQEIDLLYQLHIDELGGTGTGSDIWGWTDPDTGKEYALMALSFGTAFVDISVPTAPVYLGKLSTATGNSLWRDVKTYSNHAFIVSEASGHGMQIFDLTQLRTVINPPIEFTATANYNGFGNAHNIAINESSGFAYAVGTGTCGAGLHMIDISNPVSPSNAGCFSTDGYTHDAQCVQYIGPDIDYTNMEICFNANENTITIVNVNDKNNPIQISRNTYTDSEYTHQGWLTEDHRYYLANDELDEQNNGHNTRTYIWDMLDLDKPQILGFYVGPKASVDHNIYVKENYAYLTNYTSGLSIVDITDIANVNLTEVASFDSYPANDGASFNGAWSNYPFFASGTTIMSDVSRGLFILRPKLCPTVAAITGLAGLANGDNSIALSWDDNLGAGESFAVFRSDGGCAVDNFTQIASLLTQTQYNDNSVTGQVPVGYKIAKISADGECESERSSCVEVQTTGMCSIAPVFAGITAVNSSNTATCGMDIQWLSASPYCGASVSYDVYRSTNPGFNPDPANRVASALNTTSWHDSEVLYDQNYYYLVRATDDLNGQQESNVLTRSNQAQGLVANGTWQVGAEIGETGINQAGRHVGWETSTAESNSGNRSYWSQNQSSFCGDLLTQNIDLTAGESSVLSFWTYYDIEDQWDGGVVEVSENAGPWDRPALSPNYPSTFNTGNDACSYTAGTPSFSGTNLTWTQHSMDLSAYQGNSINIRWNFSSDGAVNETGWFVDDISVSNTQTPGQCSSNVDLIFTDGFD